MSTTEAVEILRGLGYDAHADTDAVPDPHVLVGGIDPDRMAEVCRDLARATGLTTAYTIWHLGTEHAEIMLRPGTP